MLQRDVNKSRGSRGGWGSWGRFMNSYFILASGKGFALHPLSFILLLPLALFGCTQPSVNRATSGGENKPQVVATSTILADLTQRVGGDEIQLKGILKPGADPHVYEPVPADSQVLEEADLTLYNGYNLEPGLIKLMNAAGLGDFCRNHNQFGFDYYSCPASRGKISTASTLLRFDWISR